jgi:hypothetical protein
MRFATHKRFRGPMLGGERCSAIHTPSGQVTGLHLLQESPEGGGRGDTGIPFDTFEMTTQEPRSRRGIAVVQMPFTQSLDRCLAERIRDVQVARHLVDTPGVAGTAMSLQPRMQSIGPFPHQALTCSIQPMREGSSRHVLETGQRRLEMLR